MKSMLSSKPTSLHVNRVKAAGRIAPLLSWRQLRDLPWVFRICFILIGVCVILLLLGILLAPIILMVS